MAAELFENRRILFAGGGTGGHIFPGLAVIDKLRRDVGNLRFMWIGTSERIESEIVPAHDVPFKPIDIDYFRRGYTPAAIISNLKVSTNLMTFKSVRQAKAIIRNFKPDVVVGLGSFVAGPVIIAASMCRIPSVLLELNAKPGRSTRWAAPSATRICLADALAERELKRFKKKIVVTGCPIREEILQTDRETGIRKMGLNPDLNTILVLGGSQGAQTINTTFLAAWELNSKRTHKQITDTQVVHQWGKKAFSAAINRVKTRSFGKTYHLFSFINQMSDALAAADVVISRAGANTIAEITAVGVPAILIPFPHAADQHQYHNAQALKINEAAEMIEERHMSMDYVLREIYGIINDPKKQKKMREASKALGKPNATSDFISVIADAGGFGEKKK
jgi:UDP-N-acetylglucosamine--N-acetylmuramyl-(pentapeptide) pyrophosphoryl-undecaprenol N-acetylglucosamine transferase